MHHFKFNVLSPVPSGPDVEIFRVVITELFNHIIEVIFGDICSEPVDVLISQFVVLVLLK